MTAILLPNGKQSFENAVGGPLVGGKLFTYAAGTNTPQTTWVDAAQTVPNTNPIILDARGEASVFWNGAYKIVLKDSLDNVIWTQDNVTAIDVAADFPTKASLAAVTGAGLIGFSYTTNYPDNTVGDALRARMYFSAWPGVDPTGVVDNGALLQAFVNFCKAVNAVPYLGRGTYLINTTVTFSAWAGFSLIGENLVSSVIKRTVTGAAIHIDSCSRGAISDIAFDGSGSPAGAMAILADGSGIGVVTIARNQFASFGGRGVYFNGTLANQMSSCIFEDNLFLSNGLIDVVPQFEARYVNDTKFLGNQYGALALGGPYPSTGAYHYSCQASSWISNFHWENLVGAGYAFCSYGRWIAERWETNQREGAIFSSTSFGTLDGCHWHTNGQQTNNTFDSLRFESCGTFTLSGCQAFNFVGVAILPKYSITFDAACTTFRVSACTFNDYGTAPINDLTAYGQIVFRGCATAAAGYSDTEFRTWQFHSGSMGPGTVFVTPAGNRGATEGAGLFLPGFTGRARRLRVYADVAPGGAETIGVTFRDNLADTALMLTLTGAAQVAVVDIPANFGPADLCSLRFVKSAAAAVGNVIAALTVDR